MRPYLCPGVLSLQSDRFAVVVEWFVWHDHGTSTGWADTVPSQTDDSGLFWFFSPTNWELMAKVLDGCALNDRYWVFAAGVTNVEYTISVTDTETDTVRQYSNPWQNAPTAITDTTAFTTCP